MPEGLVKIGNSDKAITIENKKIETNPIVIKAKIKLKLEGPVW